MARLVFVCVVIVLVILSLAACNIASQGQGPTTWIDQPLDGVHVPLGPLTIQAHASDADGITAVEFYVAGNLISSVSAGNQRLGEASIQWMPPTAGVYVISVSATDSQGNAGSKASVQISVGDAVMTSTPTPAPAQLMTGTPTPAPASSGPAFNLMQNANCRSGPGTAYEIDDTLFEGQTVSIEGRNEESNWLWVKKPSGSSNCWVSVITGQVTGNLDVVQVVSAVPPPEATNQPSADSAPPDISGLSADPTSIQAAGCGEPSTTVISATVSDAGGVSRVMARVPGVGEFEMGSVGGDAYQAVLGPFNDTGEFSIIIFAWDNAGNAGQAGPLTITVGCIG